MVGVRLNLKMANIVVLALILFGIVVYLRQHQSRPAAAEAPQPSASAEAAPASSSTAPSSSAATPANPAPGAAAVAALRSAATKRMPRLAFLGSSLTAGCCTSDFGHTWPYLLQRRLEAAVGGLNVTRHVYPGTSLPQIVSKGGPAATVADAPDVVVFETSGTNDCGQGVTEADSDKALASALSTLRKSLPHAVIVVQTSSPKTDRKLCAGGITYAHFMSDQATFLRGQKGVLFFDLYAAMDARIGKNLKPYLHDITHPNDAGAALWASLLERYLGV